MKTLKEYLQKLWSGNGSKKLIQREEQVTIGMQGDLVIMNFRRPIKFLSMDGMTAVKMGSALKKRGQECLKMKK